VVSATLVNAAAVDGQCMSGRGNVKDLLSERTGENVGDGCEYDHQGSNGAWETHVVVFLK